MAAPLILFGAFDRHNFGDLLLARVAEVHARRRYPGRPLVFAGVARRDLRPWDGHATRALAEVARSWGKRRADLWHVGGEVLTCSLYEAAVMTQPPGQAETLVARYDADPLARQAWARRELGLERQVAYLASKALFRNPGRFAGLALGGVDLAQRPPAFQAEARATLAEMDRVSVRDRRTQAHLAAWGLQVALAPDPGEEVAALFADTIARRADAVAEAGRRFPRGYLAFQCGPEFVDDATLRVLSGQLRHACRETGLGLVLFRAGAAPWHDSADAYHRLLGHLGEAPAMLFPSLRLWDICALLAGARAVAGSSLHARLVARAFGVAGVSLAPDDALATGKVAAYGATWWADSPPPVGATGLARALEQALALRKHTGPPQVFLAPPRGAGAAQPGPGGSQ